MKVLVAEDAPEVAGVVRFGAHMIWPGCQVTIADDGEEALARFEEERPDLVVLDIQMPPPDGFEVCRRIREVSQVPILVLTVRDQTVDKVRALDLGADDYLTKPFDDLELQARLRSLLRRSCANGSRTEATLLAGGLTLDHASKSVLRQGESTRLTATEYRLLEELVRNAGNVLPHSVLLDRVWGPEYVAETKYLKVYVRRLRNKLDDDPNIPRYIENVRGVGYRFIPTVR